MTQRKPCFRESARVEPLQSRYKDLTALKRARRPLPLLLSSVLLMGCVACTPPASAPVQTQLSSEVLSGEITGAVEAQSGLLGEYFGGLGFSGNRATRIDPAVNFDWAAGAPGVNGVGSDTFSVRWSGKITPLYSETYNFYTTADDGVRLRVNGRLVTEDFSDHSARESSGTIALEAGRSYDLQLEYFENTGLARVKLEWQSASQPRQIVPKSRLSPTLDPSSPANSPFDPAGFAWTNPGFEASHPLPYDPRQGPGTGAARDLALEWRTIPSTFAAARPEGFGLENFGMSVNSPKMRGNFPQFPLGMVKLWSAGWEEVNPARGQFDFSNADADVNRAVQKGVKVMLVLGTATPQWARRSGNPSGCLLGQDKCYPPRDLNDYREYVRAVVKHFRGRVQAYEPWNEWVSASFWGGSVAEFVELQKTFYEAVKLEDPAALALMGSGSGWKDQYENYLNDFEKFLELGGGAYMDAANWHPYGDPERFMVPVIRELRGLMNRYNIGGKDLWLTEMNTFNTAPGQKAAPLEGASLLGRWLLNMGLEGAGHFIFFQHDGASDVLVNFDTRYFEGASDKSLDPVRNTFIQVAQWLSGTQFLEGASGPNGLQALKIRRGSALAYVLWRSSGEGRVRLPAQWQVNKVQDINGAVSPVSSEAGIGIWPRLFYR